MCSTNDYSEHVIDRSELPHYLIKSAVGDYLLQHTQPRVITVVIDTRPSLSQFIPSTLYTVYVLCTGCKSVHFYRAMHCSAKLSVAWSKGRRPSGAVLHSSREPGVRHPCNDFMDMLRHFYKLSNLSYYYYYYYYHYHYYRAMH